MYAWATSILSVGAYGFSCSGCSDSSATYSIINLDCIIETPSRVSIVANGNRAISNYFPISVFVVIIYEVHIRKEHLQDVGEILQFNNRAS